MKFSLRIHATKNDDGDDGDDEEEEENSEGVDFINDGSISRGGWTADEDEDKIKTPIKYPW